MGVPIGSAVRPGRRLEKSPRKKQGTQSCFLLREPFAGWLCLLPMVLTRSRQSLFPVVVYLFIGSWFIRRNGRMTKARGAVVRVFEGRRTGSPCDVRGSGSISFTHSQDYRQQLSSFKRELPVVLVSLARPWYLALRYVAASESRESSHLYTEG